MKFKNLIPVLLTLWLCATLTAQAQLVGEGKSITLDQNRPIWDVARELGLAAEHLAWANGLEVTSQLSSGDEIEIPQRILPSDHPENGVVTNLPERGFYLWLNNEYQGFYPLAIGEAQPPRFQTPTGDFEITSVIKNPKWHAPDSEWADAYDKDTIAASSEKNPIGDYWFGISAPGYGYHENVSPKYTGDAVSHGCMRLYPRHAEQLYDHLEVGMSSRIEYEPVRTYVGDEGIVYMSVFPDVYRRMDLLSHAERMLEGHELGEDVDLAQIVEDASGRPVPVARSEKK